jgi:GxxExxY protein
VALGTHIFEALKAHRKLSSKISEYSGMEINEVAPVNELSYEVIGCAIEVHRNLGPGLLESIYEQCLAYEISKKGLRVRAQVPITVAYKDAVLDYGYRLDLLVEDSLIVEIKSVDGLLSLHEAQLLTYMKLSKVPLGLLMNFNCVPLRKGIRRFRI